MTRTTTILAALFPTLAACAARTTAPAAPAPTVAERVAASERMSLAGDLAGAEAILTPALTAAGNNPVDRARLLLQLGQVRATMFWRWDIRADLATDLLEEAVTLAEKAGDPDLHSDALDAATMLTYAVKLFHGNGDWSAIDARFTRALELARDDRRRAAIRFHLGLVQQMQGNLGPAEEHFIASLDMARRSGEDQIAGEDLRHLAYVAGMRGDHAAAIALHTQSLRLRQKIGNPPGVATAHLALGQVQLEAGDETAARKNLEAAFRLAREHGLGYPQVSAGAALARLEARAGRAAEAGQLVERAMLIARYRRDDEDLTQALLAAAEVSAALGQAEPARARLAEARVAAQRTGDPELRRACDDTARRLRLTAP
jgi:tetratricopeptide (TPR) repeat protein